jgi:hypothetical protein
MTEPRDQDEGLRDFLARRAGPLPDRVLQAVDAEARRTRQVRQAVTELPMQRRVYRWPIIAAAAGVVILVGIVTVGQLLPNLPGFGGQPSRTAEQPSPPPDTVPPSAAVVPSPTAGGTSPAGMWSTLDIDGSPMTLSVSTSGTAWSVSWVDLRSTNCAGSIFLAQGGANWDGAMLTAAGTGGCQGTAPDAPYNATFAFDPAPDTLTERDIPSYLGLIDITWRRDPTPPDAFDAAWTAVTAPSRRIAFEGSGLVRTVRIFEAASALCGGQAYDATGTGTIGSKSGEGRFLTVTLAGGCPADTAESVVRFEFRYDTNRLRGPLSATGESIGTTIDWER